MVWRSLIAVGVAGGVARADVTIRAEDGGSIDLTRTGVDVTARGADVGRELLRVLDSTGHVEHAALLTIDLSVPGTILRAERTVDVEKMFLISVDTWASGAGTVSLHTFADAWMSHDLRGHKQPDIQAANAPRLTAALREITSVLGVDVVPGDATSFGVPTVSGFKDLPDEDPDLLDSWYMFEIPRRTDRLRALLPMDLPQFSAETQGQVDYMEVTADGKLVGFVWAADSDDAAGFEPYTPAGDLACEIAEHWLLRLSKAKARGLSPSQAMRVPASDVGDTAAISTVTGALRHAKTLEEVQDLSGRE